MLSSSSDKLKELNEFVMLANLPCEFCNVINISIGIRYK